MHCAECKRAAHFQEGTGVSLDAGAFSSQEQRLTTCVFVFCTVDCDDSTTTVTVTYPAVTVSAWTPFLAPDFHFGSSLPGRPVSKSCKKRLTTAALENND